VGVAEAFRSSRYWRIAASAFLAAVATIGITVHFVPMLTAFSISRSEAATIAGAIGIASIAGRIVTGYLLDRFPGNLIGAIAFGLPILACVGLLNFTGSQFSAFAIAAIIGFALGAETDIIGYVSSRYFGLRNYGVLFGTIVGLLTLAAGVGPAIGGVVYDIYGTYEPMIWALIPTFLVCSALMASLGSYPKAFQSSD
jgi:predicted MFS family arabinose efflux permease